jgi:hypothetical protein
MAVHNTAQLAREGELATVRFWAVLVAGFAGAGLVTLFSRPDRSWPVIGYATWHGATWSRSPADEGRRGNGRRRRPLGARWVMALLALLGLGLASRAEDDVLYATGLGLFVFCILFIFYLIHRNVGR